MIPGNVVHTDLVLSTDILEVLVGTFVDVITFIGLFVLDCTTATAERKKYTFDTQLIVKKNLIF